MGIAPDIPDAELHPPATLSPEPDDLVVYIMSVGDGDSIVIQFPQVNGSRKYGIVDSFNGTKSAALLNNLHAADGGTGPVPVRFMCATHPHFDHIRGLGTILNDGNVEVEEFWDSGVYFRYTEVPEGRPWPKRYQANNAIEQMNQRVRDQERESKAQHERTVAGAEQGARKGTGSGKALEK